MYFRQIIGKYGEDLACNYLKDNNYIILERNFYSYMEIVLGFIQRKRFYKINFLEKT